MGQRAFISLHAGKVRSGHIPITPYIERVGKRYATTRDLSTANSFLSGWPPTRDIQARRRKHPTQSCRPRTPMQVEHEYFRCGAWTYIAALDIHRARIFGRCEAENGIAPFGRLVEQVMTRPPYNDPRRVFWIVDNCSAHRGARAAERLRNLYPSLTLVHAPVHARWLNQIEIDFSIVQRKVLTGSR